MKQEDKLVKLIKAGEEAAVLRKSSIDQLGPRIIQMADLVSGVIGAGGKIMIIGNAELAAIASHLATNLVIRFKSENSRQSLPALSLCSDSVVMTAAAAEFGYDEMFSRQIEGLGHKGDLLFILSANGNAGNLLAAIKTAQHKNIITAALLGGNGGKIAKVVERSLIIPHPSEQRVLEEMLFILHLMVELIESDLFV